MKLSEAAKEPSEEKPSPEKKMLSLPIASRSSLMSMMTSCNFTSYQMEKLMSPCQRDRVEATADFEDDAKSDISDDISDVSTACTPLHLEQPTRLASQPSSDADSSIGSPCPVSKPRLSLPIPTRTVLLDRDPTSSKCNAATSKSSLDIESITLDMAITRAPQLAHKIEVEQWCPENFEVVGTLQEAPRNQGRVDLMKNIVSGGGFVAVKRMPNMWMTSGHKEFMRSYPDETELPWVDIGILKYLSKMEFPYACTLQGVFRSNDETFVVSSFATEGDLFSWTECAPKPGAAREALMQPIAKQIFAAVDWLHKHEIAHGDLSLENILLTRDVDQNPQVKLIDFGMATISQKSCWEPRGKPMYQAPEMHEGSEYDPMAADAFALGVVLFTLAWDATPWKCTRRGGCPYFDYVMAHGFKKYVEQKSVRRSNNDHFVEVISEPLVDLMDGLMEVQPEDRLTLVSTSWHDELVGPTVWDSAWLREC